jgi:hypothetical protein
MRIILKKMSKITNTPLLKINHIKTLNEQVNPRILSFVFFAIIGVSSDVAAITTTSCSSPHSIKLTSTYHLPDNVSLDSIKLCYYPETDQPECIETALFSYKKEILIVCYEPPNDLNNCQFLTLTALLKTSTQSIWSAEGSPYYYGYCGDNTDLVNSPENPPEIVSANGSTVCFDPNTIANDVHYAVFTSCSPDSAFTKDPTSFTSNNLTDENCLRRNLPSSDGKPCSSKAAAVIDNATIGPFGNTFDFLNEKETFPWPMFLPAIIQKENI